MRRASLRCGLRKYSGRISKSGISPSAAAIACAISSCDCGVNSVVKPRRLASDARRAAARYGANFSREAEFAERCGVLRERAVAKRRCDRKRDAQIGGGFVHAQTAGDRCIDVVIAELHADAPLEHGEDHRQARLIEIGG